MKPLLNDWNRIKHAKEETDAPLNKKCIFTNLFPSKFESVYFYVSSFINNLKVETAEATQFF